MNEIDDFLSEVIPQLRQEVAALHSGDAEPRKVWSHDDPVTLFGAELSRRGWGEIEPAFDRLAASFSGSQSCDYEVLGAGVPRCGLRRHRLDRGGNRQLNCALHRIAVTQARMHRSAARISNTSSVARECNTLREQAPFAPPTHAISVVTGSPLGPLR